MRLAIFLLIALLTLTGISQEEDSLLSLLDSALANSAQWLKVVEIIYTKANPLANMYSSLWRARYAEGDYINLAPSKMTEIFCKYKPKKNTIIKWEEAVKIVEKEVFPLLEEIIQPLEEQASYFLLWLAYNYSFYDKDLIKELVRKASVRYPDAGAGRIAKSILEEAKEEKELIFLLHRKFEQLKNPVDTDGEEANTVKEKIRRALTASKEYRQWLKTVGELEKLKSQNIPGVGSVFFYAVPHIKIITSILDNFIAYLYSIMAIPTGTKYYEVQKKLSECFPHTPWGYSSLLNLHYGEK